MKQPLGVILAGGLATRMGGGDKGLLRLGDRSILSHVVARLEPQVAAIALNANGAPDRFKEFGLPVIADSIEGYPGPLAGVLAGMDWAADQGADSIVTVAADTPFFPMDLVPHLLLASEDRQHLLALACTPRTGADDLRSGGKVVNRHPTFGLWPVALRDDLRQALGEGVRKVVAWTSRHDAGEAVFPAQPFDPFFNVNTPDDLAQADRLLWGGRMKIYGVTGRKDTGKTGLVERLVGDFTRRGLTVSTVKHAHHDADIDQPGRDSFRHREGGAQEVLLSTPDRWALMHELRGKDEPSLDVLLQRLTPVDLVLIEGYKSGPHPKIETFRKACGSTLLAADNASIRAIAADCPVESDLPVFDLDDTKRIADFILREVQ